MHVKVSNKVDHKTVIKRDFQNILFAKRGKDAWIYEMGIPIQLTEMA